MTRKRLYVGNLDYSVTKEQVKKLFSDYGQVKGVWFVEGNDFGFVVMSNPSEAERAIEELDLTDFKGRVLRVKEAYPRRRRYTGQDSRVAGVESKKEVPNGC